jgi:hypothetical protein
MPGLQPPVRPHRAKVSCPPPQSTLVDDYTGNLPDMRDTIRSFLCDLSFTNPRIAGNPDLEDSLFGRVRSWNIDDGREGKVFERITKLSATITEARRSIQEI